MGKMDERVDMIGTSILAQAKHESEELIEKANAIRETEIKAFEDHIIRDLFDEVQKQTAKLRADTVKAISEVKSTTRRNLLKHREDLVSMALASVKARLQAYTRTPAYAETMKKEWESLQKEYDHSASTVYLREEDLPLAKEIEALLPGCAVQPDKTIKIGGWKLLNKQAAILIDETLDTRQRVEPANNTRMSL